MEKKPKHSETNMYEESAEMSKFGVLAANPSLTILEMQYTIGEQVKESISRKSTGRDPQET